ncbi:hypothetical protein DL95DRAFT_453550 [Leptodontidium sp. 2 PMI_412]|nr:hypothetical protein DL95DRAFT_453550 [Leptodontidium sp. 2 PMI_412]
MGMEIRGKPRRKQFAHLGPISDGKGSGFNSLQHNKADGGSWSEDGRVVDSLMIKRIFPWDKFCSRALSMIPSLYTLTIFPRNKKKYLPSTSTLSSHLLNCLHHEALHLSRHCAPRDRPPRHGGHRQPNPRLQQPIAPGKLTGHYNGISIDATSLDEVVAQITAKGPSFNLTEIVAARRADKIYCVPVPGQPWKLVNVNQIDPIIGLIGVTADVEWYVPARHCSDFNIQTAQAIRTICNDASDSSFLTAECVLMMDND